MRQVKRRSYWRFSDNFLGKNKMIKRGKCLGKPRMTYIHRWFSGRKPEVTGPKHTFSRSRRHDWTQQPIEKSVGMQKVVIISHQSLKKNDIVQTKESLQEKPHYIMSHLCHISFMCYYSLGLILFNQKCWRDKQRRCRLPPCCRAATAKGNCCGSLLPIKRCGHLFFVPSF